MKIVHYSSIDVPHSDLNVNKDSSHKELPKESYIIGAGIYYVHSNSFLENGYRAIQPTAHYCWCLFKEIQFSYGATLEVEQILGSACVTPSEKSGQIQSEAHSIDLSKGIAHCLDAQKQPLKGPSYRVLLYGLEGHHIDVNIKWDRAKANLDTLNKQIKDRFKFNACNVTSINHYIYRMLAQFFGFVPFVFERYPLNDGRLKINSIRTTIREEETNDSSLIEPLNVSPSASLCRHGLTTPPASPRQTDDLPTPPHSPGINAT